jgi:hypothetical protein
MFFIWDNERRDWKRKIPVYDHLKMSGFGQLLKNRRQYEDGSKSVEDNKL